MADLTIDELAAKTGLTSRNIRSYQTRGMLPGPQMRGRVGYYGVEHIERLDQIRQLQAEGLSLKLVERFMRDRSRAAEQLLEFRREVLGGFEPKTSASVMTAEELVARFGGFGGRILDRAVAFGALIPRDDGSFDVPRPELLDVATAVIGQGISMDAAVTIAETVRRSCDVAAQAFVDMVVDEVWRPFVAAGRPDDRLANVVDTIDQIRPLASEVMLALLPSSIVAAIDRSLGEELGQQLDRDARSE